MKNEKKYSVNEICELLNISAFTLRHWYDLQTKQIKDGLIEKEYLPTPERDMTMKGRPRYWTEKQLRELKDYQASITYGRNGIYGVYSNPNHKETKKYKNSLTNG